MLITAVPSKPDYLRVKLRRRIQRLGAVGLKGAVYLLPETVDAAESFRWLRREILADGGDATVCVARLVDGMTNADVIALFGRDRDAEYREFVTACRELEARWSAAANDQGARPSLTAERERLRRRLEEILGRDYFAASQREAAMQAIERVAVLDIAPIKVADSAVSRGAYRGRVWATRAGVKVDRISSAWLIRRRIDPDASFLFVTEGTAPGQGSVRFDMFDGEFTHDGARCTFEVLLDRFALTDPALRVIGEMVHDIDLHDGRYGRPETAGFAAMIDGVIAASASDEERLSRGAGVLELMVAGVERSSKGARE